MNLQILSNTVLTGRENKTNNFEMKLLHSINALNNPVFLEVLEVSYPATTKNIGKDDTWFVLQIWFDDFKKNESGVFEKNQLHFKSDTINVPEGFYTLKNLINFLNNSLEEYGIYVSKENNSKIKISSDLYVEYWLNQKSNSTGKQHDGENLNNFHLSSKSSENLQKKFKINMVITLSQKLGFILGFKQNVIHFIQEIDNTPINSTVQSIFSDYSPDVSDGLNKFYIYCEELERVLVGDTSSELLAVVPINWEKQGKGNGELITYQCDNSKKQFKKSLISSLHISIRDGEGNLLPFDSGTVLINCLIHNA